MTPPSAGSVAHTPPMQNPYPQWMSGMARLAPWMPGSVATFATCSGAWSLRIDSISLSLAKMRPSTRMSARYDFGMRKQHSNRPVRADPAIFTALPMIVTRYSFLVIRRPAPATRLIVE